MILLYPNICISLYCLEIRVLQLVLTAFDSILLFRGAWCAGCQGDVGLVHDITGDGGNVSFFNEG